MTVHEQIRKIFELFIEEGTVVSGGSIADFRFGSSLETVLTFSKLIIEK